MGKSHSKYSQKKHKISINKSGYSKIYAKEVWSDSIVSCPPAEKEDTTPGLHSIIGKESATSEAEDAEDNISTTGTVSSEASTAPTTDAIIAEETSTLNEQQRQLQQQMWRLEESIDGLSFRIDNPAIQSGSTGSTIDWSAAATNWNASISSMRTHTAAPTSNIWAAPVWNTGAPTSNTWPAPVWNTGAPTSNIWAPPVWNTGAPISNTWPAPVWNTGASTSNIWAAPVWNIAAYCNAAASTLKANEAAWNAALSTALNTGTQAANSAHQQAKFPVSNTSAATVDTTLVASMAIKIPQRMCLQATYSVRPNVFLTNISENGGLLYYQKLDNWQSVKNISSQYYLSIGLREVVDAVQRHGYMFVLQKKGGLFNCYRSNLALTEEKSLFELKSTGFLAVGSMKELIAMQPEYCRGAYSCFVTFYDIEGRHYMHGSIARTSSSIGIWCMEKDCFLILGSDNVLTKYKLVKNDVVYQWATNQYNFHCVTTDDKGVIYGLRWISGPGGNCVTTAVMFGYDGALLKEWNVPELEQGKKISRISVRGDEMAVEFDEMKTFLFRLI